MKRTIIFIFLIIIAIIYFNCKSSTTGPSSLNSLSSISGTIQSWTQGTKILKLITDINYTHVLATSNIDNSGNFSINLPGNVADSLLMTPSFTSDSNCTYQITMNPSNLKFSIMSLEVYSDTIVKIGYITKEFGNQMQSGYKLLYYLYFNSSGSMNGSFNCNHSGSISIGTIAVTFPKGWYFMVYNLDSNSSNYTKYHNNTDQSGLTWNYHAGYDNNFSDKNFKK